MCVISTRRISLFHKYLFSRCICRCDGNFCSLLPSYRFHSQMYAYLAATLSSIHTFQRDLATTHRSLLPQWTSFFFPFFFYSFFYNPVSSPSLSTWSPPPKFGHARSILTMSVGMLKRIKMADFTESEWKLSIGRASREIRTVFY